MFLLSFASYPSHFLLFCFLMFLANVCLHLYFIYRYVNYKTPLIDWSRRVGRTACINFVFFATLVEVALMFVFENFVEYGIGKGVDISSGMWWMKRGTFGLVACIVLLLSASISLVILFL